jgi:Ca-activated chloride channel family protein
MKKILLITTCCLFCLLPTFTAEAASAAKEVKEGNRLYKQEKYDDALAKYSSARTELPDSDIVNFNIGTAMYKKGDFQNAVDAFTRALVTEDKELEAGANFNIANSKYRLGNLKINTDLSGAVSFYREALDYYKRTIELKQDDTEAKYNHELVERKLKVLLDRMKNQPEQKDQKQDKQDKDGKEGNSQSAAVKDQKEKKEAGEQEAQAQQSDSEKEAKKEEGQAAETASGEETNKMSPEEARMLLEAYGQEEAGDRMKRHKGAYFPGVQKDW